MASSPDAEDVKATILELSNNPLPGKMSVKSIYFKVFNSTYAPCRRCAGNFG